MTVSRMPHLSGSDSRTFLPVFSLVTKSSGISSWACPTRMASMSGTCCASRVLAFSG